MQSILNSKFQGTRDTVPRLPLTFRRKESTALVAAEPLIEELSGGFEQNPCGARRQIRFV